jgi:signal transduction histidine kinase/DNA-binding response OmpR family regulator/sugar lactone lactonase YvrE
VKAPGALSTGTDHQINAIHEDRSGMLWLGTPSGLIRYDRRSGEHILFPHRFAIFRYGWGVILRIAEDGDGHFWLATLTGLMKFDPGTGSYTYYQHDPEDPNSLSYNNISSLWLDRTDIVWAGTAGQGINLYDPKADRFKTLQRKPVPGTRIAGFSIRALLEDDKGGVWISAGVLYRWDRVTGTLKSFETHSNFPDDFGNTEISSLCQDSRGIIWAAGIRGLFRFDPSTGRSRQFKYDPGTKKGIPEPELLALCEDRSGDLWVAGRYTLNLVRDRDRGIVETFVYQPEKMGERNGHVVILEDVQGELWLGTMTGLFRFDPATGNFRHFRHNPSDPRGLSSNHIKSLAADPLEPQRFLWIGTVNGLDKLDLDSMTFTHYRERDGLPNEVVYGILPDAGGQLWLSTNKGLSRFDPGTETFRNYDAKDGLQSNEFNTGAFHRGKSGELFFGGVKGLNYFFPEAIRDNPYPPRLAITRIDVLDQPTEPGALVRLTHRENHLTFAFAALDYSAPDKNRYAYMLEGFNAQWIQAGHHRTATYTNLPPGTYTFRVKGANNDGVWNEEGIAVPLRILPPWWHTWWAYLCYAAFVLTLLLTLRRYELHRLRLRSQLKLERVQSEGLRRMDELKSRFFANISHELRTPLTLILGQLEALRIGERDQGHRGRILSASQNAQRLLDLINQILDLSRLDAGKTTLDTRAVELVTFLGRLVDQFETQAGSRNLSLRFHASSQEITAMVDADKMEKVFVNLIANALKFSEPGGSVLVSADLVDGESVVIRVRDEGPGIAAEHLPYIFDRFYQADDSDTRKYPGTGIGLAIVQEYVKLHGGTVKVSSTSAADIHAGTKGTEFVIEFPRGELRTSSATDWSPPEAETGPSVPVTAVEGQDRHPLILLVEDHAEMQSFIREQLEPHYRVLTAGNGQEAIACSRQEIPDLIITDWMMPEMDGYAFARKIKSDERTSHIPVIMLTAKSGLEDKITGLETGIEAYLTKPFSIRELLVRVEALIRERDKLRKRFATATVIRPSEVSVVPADQRFMAKALQVTEEQMEDEQFRVEALAVAMNMSTSQLNRKLQALVGQSGSKFIQSIRLQRAADLLRQKAGTVAEISYQVGFTDQAYFARAFRKQFGCSPTEFAVT